MERERERKKRCHLFHLKRRGPNWRPRRPETFSSSSSSSSSCYFLLVEEEEEGEGGNHQHTWCVRLKPNLSSLPCYLLSSLRLLDKRPVSPGQVFHLPCSALDGETLKCCCCNVDLGHQRPYQKNRDGSRTLSVARRREPREYDSLF